MNINAADLFGTATPPGPSSATGKSQKTNVDGNTFLTLLVAQLKNQDPLAPQDGAQFVAQLAQFNSLEQLISINDRIGKLIGQTPAATTQVGAIKE